MEIPEGFAQATLNFTSTVLPNGAAIVLGVGNDTDLDAGTIANRVMDAFGDTVMTDLTAITLSNVVVKLGPNEDGPIGISSIAPINGGVAIADTEPAQVCYLVNKVTPLGGRRMRGRMFVPGVSENTVDGSGTVTVAQQAALQVEFDAFRARLLADAIPPFLLHGPATVWVLVNGQPRRQPVGGVVPAPTPIDSFVVLNKVGTQRRRLR